MFMRLQRLLGLVTVFFAAANYQNCAQSRFAAISPQEKVSILQGDRVFPDGVEFYGGFGYGSIPVGGQGQGSIPVGQGSQGNGSLPVGSNGSQGQGSLPVGSGGSTGVGSIPVTGGTTSTGSGSNPSLFPTGSSTGAGASMGASAPGLGGPVLSEPTTGGIFGNGILGETPASLIPTIFTHQDQAIPVHHLCSDYRSDANGNLATSQTLMVELLNDNRQVICAYEDTSLRSTLLQDKILSLQSVTNRCANLAAGKYVLRIRDPLRSRPSPSVMVGGHQLTNYIQDAVTTNLVYNHQNESGFIIQKHSNGTYSWSDRHLLIVTDRNPDLEHGNQHNDASLLTSVAKCDARQSPLVIHMNSDIRNPSGLFLSSQAAGVIFDILGFNSYPAAHTPKRISWHKNLSYVFLALPNSNGEVIGVDQLFGNNTMGPDGKFAVNGYAALAKYDGRTVDGKSIVGPADGYITEHDPIFSQLRVWRDENFDGVAQKHELYSLSGAGVKLIDLHFDPTFYEEDKYGNQTKYKSVVLTRDNRLHLMFDLWFKYLEK